MSNFDFSFQCDYLSNFIRTQVPDPERKSAQAILSKLFYNNLAQLINLDGGNNKIAFRGLLLFKVFEGALQSFKFFKFLLYYICLTVLELCVIGCTPPDFKSLFSATLLLAFPTSDLSIAKDALQSWLKDAKRRKQMPDSVCSKKSSAAKTDHKKSSMNHPSCSNAKADHKKSSSNAKTDSKKSSTNNVPSRCNAMPDCDYFSDCSCEDCDPSQDKEPQTKNNGKGSKSLKYRKRNADGA